VESGPQDGDHVTAVLSLLHMLALARRSSLLSSPLPLSIRMDGFAALDQLVDIITTGVADLKRAYNAAGASAPSIDQPWTPTTIEEETSAQVTMVAAAAFQLSSTLRNPNTIMWEATSGVRARIAIANAGY
jgi:hypothetical protein